MPSINGIPVNQTVARIIRLLLQNQAEIHRLKQGFVLVPYSHEQAKIKLLERKYTPCEVETGGERALPPSPPPR